MSIFSGKTRWLLSAIIFLTVCASSPSGIVILCAGDSITAADYPYFLQKQLNQEGILAKVLNYGRNGDNSSEYLSFLRTNADILAEEHPDFILIQLGTNDVREDHDRTTADQFSENIRNILKIFKAFQTRSGKTPQCLIATIPPVPENSSFPFTEHSRQRVKSEINPIIREIADTEGLVLVDNYALFSDHPLLLPEIHPSREGYRKLAQNWFHSLKPSIK